MVQYWMGRFGGSERRLILLAALVLLPVFFLPVLPIWQMKMWAPQYREGLTLTIFSHTIAGDIDKVNTLNHYVGMKAISAQDFDEFRYMPQLLTGFGVMALLAALTGWRWLALAGWIGFTAFAGYMFTDYIQWLWRYGHELDPRAAITLDTFMPPVIGFQKMANFKVLSIPGPGTVLLGAAWLLGPVVLWLERRASRRRTVAVEAARVVVAAALMTGLIVAPAPAATHRAPAAAGAAALALAAAAPGDTVVLAAGVHPGPLRVARPLVLRGEPGAVVDGGGAGSVVVVTGSGATVEDLAIRASGKDVMAVDAGVHLALAAGVTLARLEIRDVLYGVNAERANGLVVRDCALTGRVRPMDESGNGNGIHLWYTSGVRLEGNRVERFLDAIYLSFANDIHVEGNRLQWNGRYGLHTMYCQTNRLVRNVFALNVAGCALMFSNHLVVEHNDFIHNRGPRTYGLLLRDCSDGTFTSNRLADNTVAVFMDGSNRNRFRSNLVENNGWALLVFASCASNEFSGNQFIQNDYPVALDMRRTSNRFDDGRTGNYWSENPAFDLDADGIGDVPYAPVGAFAFVSKQYPDLTILAKSPAVLALGVAERVIPALRPSEAVDHFPLVNASRLAAGGSVAGIPRPAEGRAWGASAAFACLGLLGAGAMAGGEAEPVVVTAAAIMIEALGLSKKYGAVPAVRDLSFSIEPGETFALIGPNGAGKTTTLKLLLGLVRPDAGRIAIGPDRLPPTDARARHHLGYVPQQVEFAPGRTVGEVLGWFASLRGLPRGAVARALERVGLTAHALRRASELSGGYTQRLSLAQALLGDPELLVLDEPTASLDPEATWEFRSLVERLRGEGVTILLCSHLLAEVERVADRVLILVDGSRAALERLDTLRARQASAQRLAIETGDPAAAQRAAQVLEAAAIPFERRNGTRLVLDAKDGVGPAALETLRGAGIAVRSFEVERPTLEEIFMSVVRGGSPS